MKPFYELLCLLWFKKIKTTLLFINLTGISDFMVQKTMLVTRKDISNLSQKAEQAPI
jgi:hypothetical protein